MKLIKNNLFNLIVIAIIIFHQSSFSQDVTLNRSINKLPFYIPPVQPSDGNSQNLYPYPGTDYAGPQQIAFDSSNRPYLYFEKVKSHAGFLLTLRDGLWTKINFQTAVENDLKANFNASSTYSLFPDVSNLAGSSIHIDDDNSLYMTIYVRDPSAATAGNVILVYSKDITATNPVFKVHKIVDTNGSNGYLEVNTGNNDTSVPPIIGVHNRINNDNRFEVYVPTKNTDGSLNLGNKIFIDSHTAGRNNHSGGRGWAVSKNGKIYFCWQGAVIPNTTTPENAYWIAEIDRSTRVVTKKYLGLGESYNNWKPDDHNFPTLTMDGQGYLHYIKGSHGSGGDASNSNADDPGIDFHYAKSPQANSISGNWVFGDMANSDATYNTSVVTTANKLITSARRHADITAFTFRDATAPNTLDGTGNTTTWSTWRDLFETDEPFGATHMYRAPGTREVADKNGNVYFLASLRNNDFDSSGSREYYTAQPLLGFNANVDSVRIMKRQDFLARITNGKSPQTISPTNNIPDVIFGSVNSFTATATSDAGIPVTSSVTGNASISGNTITLGSGALWSTIDLEFSASSNGSYYADKLKYDLPYVDAVSYIHGSSSFYGITAGDFDNDGTDEIAIIREKSKVSPEDQTTNRIVILKGTKAFKLADWSYGGYDFSGITASDFNNDGKDEIAILRRDGNSSSVINRVITFDMHGNKLYEFLYGGVNIDGITSGDFDGDGTAEIALYRAVGGSPWNGTKNRVVILEADGTYRSDYTYGGYDFKGITAGDFDGDGDDDIAVFRRDGNHSPTLKRIVTLNGLTGSKLNEWVVPDQDIFKFTAGDFDNDSTDEIIVLRANGGSPWDHTTGTVLTYEPNGSLLSNQVHNGNGILEITAGDFDGLGYDELGTYRIGPSIPGPSIYSPHEIFVARVRTSSGTSLKADTSSFLEVSKSEKNPSLVRIYPNPVKHQLSLSGKFSQESKVVIYSLSGQPVRRFDIENTLNPSFNVSDLPNGYYILQVNDSEGGKQSFKFIKE